MKELPKAILEVMKTVKSIDKDMTVGSGSYSYQGVSDKEVKRIIGDAMQKNGLCIIPIDVDAQTTVSRWEESYNGQKKEKQSIFTEVKTKYLLIHSSGESIELSGYGHGVDTQDKAAGKATTYALKYTLLYTFLVPTGKIDDSDNTQSEETQIPKPSKPKANLSQWKKIVEKFSNGEVTTDQINENFSLTSEQEKELKELS